MAIIGELRKRSGIIIVAIALSLVAFLLMQALSNNKSALGGSKNPDYAKIDGTTIVATDPGLNEKYNDVMMQYVFQSQQFNQFASGQLSLDNQTKFGITERAWDDFVNDFIIDHQLSKLGLTITDQEFTDLIYGADPHPYIKNNYAQNGKFDPAQFAQYVQQIKDPQIQQNNPQAVQAYYYFAMLEKLAKRDYMSTKYTALFTEAAYVPEWMTKHDYEVKNRRASFSFVDLPYAAIADSTVKYSDSDLKTYYESHKNSYKMDESRVVSYVSWPFIPTHADSVATMTRLTDNVEKLKNAKNDSSYIVAHSEDPSKFDNVWMTRTELLQKRIDTAMVDSFFAKPIKALVGPYYEGGFYKVAKVWDKKTMPDSADVRDIFVAITDSLPEAKAEQKADSVLALLKGGADFATLALQYSDDNSSKDAGGDLGWSTPKMNFVPEFKKYVFETGTVGEVGKVKTQYGIHLIEIKSIKNRKEFINMAFLSTQILPGKTTEDSVDRIAGAFYDKYQTPETFAQGVKENHLTESATPPLTKNMYEIPNMADSREIIDWAYNNDKGTFKYFSMEDEIIIAYIKDVRKDGIQPLDNVKEQVTQEVIREKKGEMLKQKLAEAVSGGATSLDAIASKVGSTVKSAEQASLGTPYAPGLGLEPKVIGAIFGTEANKLTKPIAGTRSAYICMVTAFTEPDANGDATLNRNQLTYALKNKLNSQNLIKTLKDKSDIVDNRYMFQ